MSIRVTCPGCHVRFNVSDKFAGREGPCPKCKVVIQIPDKSDEVVIHEQEIGPKDSKGRLITKPVRRTETKLSGLQIAIMVAVMLGFVVGAAMLRMIEASQFRDILLGAGAALLAVPCVYAAYSFIRDQERGAFLGRELWLRVFAVSAVYALIWFAIPLAGYAFNGEFTMTWLVGGAGMILFGALIGMVGFDFDYLSGVLHYGFYFLCCLLLRVLSGVSFNSSQPSMPNVPTPTLPESGTKDLFSDLMDAALNCMADVGGWF